MRGRPGRGGAGSPGTPDSTGARSPETGAGGLPFRVRPPRRPESSDIAGHNMVILSDHDLAVIQKAVAASRQDAKDDRRDAAAGQHGTGPGRGTPAEELRETRPTEPAAVRRPDENRTRLRRRLLLYALAAASIVVAAALADHQGVLPRVDATTSSSPAQVGGPPHRPQLLPPLNQPPVMHFSSAVSARSTPWPQSATDESSGGRPSATARGG